MTIEIIGQLTISPSLSYQSSPFILTSKQSKEGDGGSDPPKVTEDEGLEVYISVVPPPHAQHACFAV